VERKGADENAKPSPDFSIFRTRAWAFSYEAVAKFQLAATIVIIPDVSRDLVSAATIWAIWAIRLVVATD